MKKTEKIVLAGLLCLLINIPNALALKVNTHVWIADEIINDAADGSLTIYVNGSPVNVPINYSLKSYLTSYKNEFRAGAIGPDAFPDPLVGQISIHPGAKDRGGNGKTWNTEDWFSHTFENAKYPNEKAFAYGTLVHGASDVISHTYVNMYAGDIFDYVKHNSSQNEPERRHLFLESYIGDLTPNLSNGLNYSESVAIPDTDSYVNSPLCLFWDGYWDDTGYGSGSFINICLEKRDFLSRAYIYSASDIVSLVSANGSSSTVKYSAVMQQYLDAKNEDLVGGSHLLSVYELRYKIEQLLQSDSLSQMDHFLATGSIFDWTNSGLSQTLVDLKQKISSAEYDSITALNNIRNEIEDVLSKSTLEAHTKTESLAKSIDTQHQKLFSYSSELLSLESKILDLESNIRYLSCPWWDWVCKELNKKISENIAALSQAKSDFNDKVIAYTSTKNILFDSVSKINEAIRGVNLVRRSIDDTAVDFAKVLLKDSNPIRAILINWAEGIDAAMLSYRTVGLDIMKAEMANTNPLDPIRKWAFTDCNIQKLIGFGSDFGSSYCELNKNAQALTDVFDELAPYLGGGLTYVINNKILELQNNTVRDQFNMLITNKLDDLAPGFIDFIDTIKQDATASVLNDEFKDGGSNGYVEISDMSARVDAEMRVTTDTTLCNGKSKCFNKMKAPLIFNAIQMSKISLLNKAELNYLSQQSGYTVNLIDGNGYSDYGSLQFDTSLLFNGLKSIDGNHQWLGDIAPPMPKDKNYSQNYQWDYDSHYGTNDGILLGASESSKKRILNSLFIGPMNEGLFTPKALGFVNNAALLTDEYRGKYDVCKGNIFQTSINDHFCNGVEDQPTSPPPPPPPYNYCSQNPYASRCR